MGEEFISNSAAARITDNLLYEADVLTAGDRMPPSDLFSVDVRSTVKTSRQKLIFMTRKHLR